jgi:hypothetical protein
MDGDGPQRWASPVLLCVGASRGQPLALLPICEYGVHPALTPAFHHVWSTPVHQSIHAGHRHLFQQGHLRNEGSAGFA